MTPRTLALTLTLAALMIATSLNADVRPGERSNPILLEGQIRDIVSEGGNVVIRLHRDRYPLVAHAHMRVRTQKGVHMHVTQLRAGDSIRVDGDLYQDFIQVNRVTLLLRVERR